MRVTVYLKTPLFAVDQVPANAWVLQGELLNQASGSFEVGVTSYHDADGRSLDGRPLRLLLPSGKVDHIVLQG